MLIITDRFHEPVPDFLGRSFRAEEAAAHVVVDAYHAIAFGREMFDRFGTDQTGGTGNDDLAHETVKAEPVPSLGIAENPGEIAIGRFDASGWKLFVARQDFLQERGVLVRIRQKTNMPRLIDQWKSKSDPPAIKFRNKIRNHFPRLFLERGRFRKEGRGVAVIADPKQNQIMAINGFAALGREAVEAILVLLRRELRIDLAPHPGYRFLRHAGQNKK